jgi:hypothetical protein
MKMVKSLLLGSAAGLVAVAGAQAADLPVKAAPVQYVKICSLYGEGYYYVPGTDICLKVGAWVRNQHYWNAASPSNGINYFGAGGRNADDATRYLMRSRGQITVDGRQQTAYGTLRTYIAIGVTHDNSTAYAPAPTGAAASSPSIYANRAFIQFAGFTFGQAVSFYDLYSTPAYSYYAGPLASDLGDPGQSVAGYTAQFGGGFSATVAVESPRRLTILNTASGAWVPGSNVANFQRAIQFPDVVANLRLDQAWGVAQIMGAIHDASATYYTGTATASPVFTGEPGDKLGWAIGGGATINLPFITPGDTFSFQVNYAQGASRYVGAGTQAGAGLYSGTGPGSTVALGFVTDGVYATNGSINLTTAFGVNAAFEHLWTPALKTSVYGGWNKYEYNSAATADICAASTAGTLGVTVLTASCSPNWSMWNIGSRTQWTPFRGLYMGVDTMFQKVNTAFGGGTIVQEFANGTRNSGVYTTEDKGVWSATFRIQRDILP